MANLRFNPWLSLVLVSMLSLAGCKKNEPTSAFTLTGDNGLDFVYGQQKSVSFTSRNIQSFSPEAPDGWSCRVENSQIVITAPLESDTDAKKSGSIKITARKIDGGDLTQTVNVAIKIAEEITTSANSYIVSEPDKRYKFDPTKRADGTVASSPAAASAKLLWTTDKEAVIRVSLEDDGYLYFATGNGETVIEGNALVAALDADDNIIWSWHVWCTDYNPETDAAEFGGETVMARNLGAFKSSNQTADDAWSSCGLFYQWGRKDPFVGSTAWDKDYQRYIYGSTGGYVNISFAESSADNGTVAYATLNPMTYILGVEGSNYDWLFQSDNTLWGNANTGTGVTTAKGSKSIYDPCPAGWMVAPPKIWADFTKDGKASSDPADFNIETDSEYNYGWIFSDNAAGADAQSSYYPAAGRRSFTQTGDSNFTNIVNGSFGDDGSPVGFYWSNSNSSATEGAFLAFTAGYVDPDSSKPAEAQTMVLTTASDKYKEFGSRAGGFQVRCVRE